MKLLTKQWELIWLSCIETNQEVNDAAKNCWSHYARRQFRKYFGPKVWAHCIHVVVCFSQENRSFIWKYEDNCLNGIETHGHYDKEQCAISILHTCNITFNIIEQNDTKKSRQTCNDQFNITGLRKSNNIQKVSSSKEHELCAPASILLQGCTVEWLHASINIIGVIF